ncbi:MAG TPA: hypothetical protein VL943_06685, partial [Niabella sp.]|nr:hypothetical protein [Niabella sp.]
IVYISYIIQNHSGSTSKGDVLIDGVKVGEISCDGHTVPMTTQNGINYASALSSFECCEGTHTLEIINKSVGKYFYVNWIAQEQDKKPVILGNIIKLSNSVYNQLGISEQTTIDYNAIVSSVADEFGALLVDNYSYIEPSLHLNDGVHPNNLGHSIIHENFKSALSGV